MYFQRSKDFEFINLSLKELILIVLSFQKTDKGSNYCERTCQIDEVGCITILRLLTHYHTMSHFDALQIYSFGKHCEKRRNCLVQAISPFFSQCFPKLYGTIFFFFFFYFKWTLKMSSALCFNLDQSKILSSGNGLIPPHNANSVFQKSCIFFIMQTEVLVSNS